MERLLPEHDATPSRFDPVCLILGWVWPGFGHLWLRQRLRGGLIMAGVLGMFVVGVLVGGVDVIDRRNDPLWFVPQALIGPLAIAADSLNLLFVTSGRVGLPSIGRVNELGTLLTALAGLMNLAAMLDAATRDPDRDMDRRDPGRPDRRAAPGATRSSIVDRESSIDQGASRS